MTTVSYSLSSVQMTSLKKLVDLGLVELSETQKPRRKEAAEVYRFLKDYIKEKSSK